MLKSYYVQIRLNVIGLNTNINKHKRIMRNKTTIKYRILRSNATYIARVANIIIKMIEEEIIENKLDEEEIKEFNQMFNNMKEQMVRIAENQQLKKIIKEK